MNNNESPQESQPQPEKGRLGFLVFAISLFGIIIAGLVWLFLFSTDSPIGLGWFLFSFASGLSMIVLPCTLPLAFVIVPLSLGKGYKKGLSIALAFGIGVAIMLSTYGILAALLGKAIFGFFGGTGETIKNIFYTIAGVFALLFAFSELGLIKFRLPSYMGSAPAFIQKRQDIAKALFLGLFLGNVGVGCPHPATPIILGQIGITGDIFYGWLLFLIHAIGRIIPLLLLAILGILGINATKSLVAHKDKIGKATAWGMIFVGSFLFTLGFFSHDWWVYSGQHSILETIVQEERFINILKNQLNSNIAHTHGIPNGHGFFELPLWLGNWVFVGIIILTLLWYYFKKKEEASEKSNSVLNLEKWFFTTLSLLLILVFTQNLPHWFLVHKQETNLDSLPQTQAILTTNPKKLMPNVPTELTFSLKNKEGDPLQKLEKDHQRILHVIIISDNFKNFSHKHPEDFKMITESELQSATLKINHTFPESGQYLISANYLHESHSETKLFRIEVGSNFQTIISKDLKRNKVFEAYSVSLETNPEVLLSGEESSLTYRIEKSEVPVESMSTYLSAPMHLAVISADLNTLEHLHGEIIDKETGEEKHEISREETFGPEIHVHALFPFPGLYQIFAEFNDQGKIIVTSFMVEVKPGKNTGSEIMPHGH